MIDLSPTEQAIISGLAELDAALPGVIRDGGGDDQDVAFSLFHSRAIRNVVMTAAANRQDSTEPVPDDVQRGGFEVEADGGHRVIGANATLSGGRVRWIVKCTEGDFTRYESDRDVARGLAYKHSLATVKGDGDKVDDAAVPAEALDVNP